MMMDLRCCGEKAPIGVDKQNIRLSFTLSGGLEIENYEINVWEAVTGKQVWHKENSVAQSLVCWVDPACLQGQTAYQWQVIAHLKNGTTAASEKARFETGLEQWQGRWITGCGTEGQVLEFCKGFALAEPPVIARLYICGLGYFSARLNGKALNEAYFIPPVTDYSARAALQVEGTHFATGLVVTY